MVDLQAEIRNEKDDVCPGIELMISTEPQLSDISQFPSFPLITAQVVRVLRLAYVALRIRVCKSTIYPSPGQIHVCNCVHMHIML